MLVVLFGQFRVDVVLGVFVLLSLFDLGEFVTDFRVVFFKQALLEGLDGLSIAFLFGVDGSFAGEYFGLLDIVLCDAFLEELFGLCDLSQGGIVIFEFDIGSGLVVVVEGLTGIKLHCFLVEIDGFVEIFLLEGFISLVLHVLSRVFDIHLLGLLLFLLGRGGRRVRVFCLMLMGVGMIVFLFLLWLRLAKFLFLELLGQILNIIGTALLG